MLIFDCSCRLSLSVLDALSRKNLTLNNHNLGVTPADFKRSSKLTSRLKVLATNFDKRGKEFISLVEVRSSHVWDVFSHAWRG